MKNIFAKSIFVDQSSVIMNNVNVFSSDVALSIENSNVEGTVVLLEGKFPMVVENSHVDLAVATLVGESRNIDFEL